MRRRAEFGWRPRLRDLAASAGILVRWVENIADEGFPDAVWCGRDGTGGLLELKTAEPRARMPPLVTFRPGQVPWLMSWSAAGGSCAVVVWFEDRLHVVPGVRALDLMRHGLAHEFMLQGFSAYGMDASARLHAALHAAEVMHGRPADRQPVAHTAGTDAARMVARTRRASADGTVLPGLPGSRAAGSRRHG